MLKKYIWVIFKTIILDAHNDPCFKNKSSSLSWNIVRYTFPNLAVYDRIWALLTAIYKPANTSKQQNKCIKGISFFFFQNDPFLSINIWKRPKPSGEGLGWIFDNIQQQTGWNYVQNVQLFCYINSNCVFPRQGWIEFLISFHQPGWNSVLKDHFLLFC